METYIHIYTHLYMHMHTHVHTHVQTHTDTTQTYIQTHSHAYIHTHTCIYTDTDTDTQMYTQTHTHNPRVTVMVQSSYFSDRRIETVGVQRPLQDHIALSVSHQRPIQGRWRRHMSLIPALGGRGR